MSSFPGVDALLRAAAIGLLLAGCVLVLWPFLTAGLLAGVICIATWPLFRFLRARWLRNSTVAAAFFTTSLAVLVVLPFGVATNAVVDAAPAWIEDVRAWAEQPDHPPPAWLVSLPLLGDWLSEYWQRLAGSREELIKLGQRAVAPSSARASPTSRSRCSSRSSSTGTAISS
jgi:predicted PurR-regulated permease PerM